MRNAVVQHCPAVAGALVDARGRRVNAHRLPIRRRSQGPSRPRVSKSVAKGFRLSGHMNEYLEIMRLCSVRMGGIRAFVSDAGHLRLPPGFCCGVRWRSISALPPDGPRSTRSVRRACGHGRDSQANGNVAKTVDSLRMRARARSLEPPIRVGHTQPAPGLVSPQGPPARPRPGGRGPHRARSGSAGPGPRRAPTAPGSPPGGRIPPQDAARRLPAPRGPAHS